MIPYWGFDSYYMILVLPTLLFALYAQIKVKSSFEHYSKVTTSRRMTGEQAARQILRGNEIYDVSVERVAGSLTDHYDPKAKVIRLSDKVFSSTSIAAVGVAAHEAGHAVQYSVGYAPIRLRSVIIPVCQIGSNLAVPIIIIGLFLNIQALFGLGILFFATAVVFQAVTLPVEFNASRRALAVLGESRMLEEDEIPMAKKVLNAAAMTYVAAMLASMAQLLRFVMMFNRRRR